MSLVPSVYTEDGSPGDFEWEIQVNYRPGVLYIFNDNEEHHNTAVVGKGNAVV